MLIDLNYKYDVFISYSRDYDGEFFPEIARKINWLLCHEYFLIGEGFKKTKRFVAFQTLMKNWIQDVAYAISNVPEWNNQWIKDEWWKETFEYSEKNLQIVSKPNKQFSGWK